MSKPIREQSALELLETHAKALEAENARLREELLVQKGCRYAAEKMGQQDIEKINQLRAALERVVPMLDEAAGTHGTEAANPRYQAAQALLVIHGALRGAVETAGKHAVCEGCGNEIDPNICGCGMSIDHSPWEGHQPVPMGCDCMRVAGPEASGEATGPEGDDSNMGTAPTSGPEATSSQGNAVETAALPYVHLSKGGRDPDEKVYSSRDVEALIAVALAASNHADKLAAEKAAGEQA